MTLTIVWTPNALNQFENTISFIKADSEINAAKFEKEILGIILKNGW